MDLLNQEKCMKDSFVWGIKNIVPHTNDIDHDVKCSSLLTSDF